MKKNCKLILLSLGMVCLASGEALSQEGPFGYFNDALLFSRTSFGGTARMQGLGGAQVSLGGDQSSAASNPAGLGFFNRSTIVLSPLLNFNNSQSSYLGEETSSFRTTFNMAHFGAALNYSRPSTSENKFRGGTFAITFSRTNDFNSEIQYEGINNSNSIVDSFIFNAGTIDPNDLGGFEGIAFDHFLIDVRDTTAFPAYEVADDGLITRNPGDGFFDRYGSLVGELPDFDESVLPRQSETVLRRGGQNQINLAWGGNYLDRLYFGAGLGIATLRYRVERTYIEDQFTFDDGTPDDLLTSITIEDEINSNGTGVNATLGVIARPLDFFTLGLSYVTPTFYTIEEQSFFTFTTNWNPFYSYQLPDGPVQLGEIITESDITVTNYSLRTPGKLNLGGTFFLGKNGFITGDVEFIDYGTAEIRTIDFREREDNQEIANQFRSVMNYRVGAEFRFDELRLRAGYNFMADPYENSEFDRSVQSISGGLGYRSRSFFMDLAVVYQTSQQLTTPYFVGSNQPVAESDLTTTNGILTFGFNF
ncbi:MAG: hypothetical protein AAGA85_12920 [Bacteroidota bacterium]